MLFVIARGTSGARCRLQPDVKLSLLDRSRTRAGLPDAAGLSGSIERAMWAEELGYDRFWVAEHHSVPGVASGSPAVILAAIGARTEHIRIGSGGVMLPNHQPYVVAEQFLMLDALYPGRIDLGIGRSRGFTAPVRAALREDDSRDFEHDLQELRAFLDGAASVTVRPQTQRSIPMFLLATGAGIKIAARQGLPVVIGGPILRDPSLGESLATYRRNFRSSASAAAPYVVISLDVTIADDEQRARDLALPEAWAMARSRQIGEFGPLESLDSIRDQHWTSQVQARIQHSLDHAVLGSPDTVRTQLAELIERTGADELLTSTSMYDRDALHASDAALRRLFDEDGRL